MEGLARDPEALSTTARSRLNFALAKAYDDLGRTDEAFDRMREGNGLKRGRIDYDEAGMLELFDRIRSTFDRRVLEAGNGCWLSFIAAGFRGRHAAIGHDAG